MENFIKEKHANKLINNHSAIGTKYPIGAIHNNIIKFNLYSIFLMLIIFILNS